MHALLVKTSSLGDVLHALPAVTDAVGAVPGLRFDWLVEEAFQEIPAWHDAVDQVIPVAVRRWRKHWVRSLVGPEWRAFRQRVRQRRYDAVIDAQGLLKSALLARFANGPRYGLDRKSAREPLASFSYDHALPVTWGEHAIGRVRRLFAQAFGYPCPDTAPDYGIRAHFGAAGTDQDPAYVVFLHGTTWPSKHWPEPYWAQLCSLVTSAGVEVWLPWGSPAEQQRAHRIAGTDPRVRVLPRCSLQQLGAILSGARAHVAVDTGVGHLAAALQVPGISLYGSTDPARTGTLGDGQQHLAAEFSCSPCLERNCGYRGESPVVPACYTSQPPTRVWAMLEAILERSA